MKRRVLSLLLACGMLLGSSSVFLASNQNITEESQVSVDVKATISSDYTVTIPKAINISSSSKQATYTISLAGDIPSAGKIKVVPSNSFVMKQAGKNDVIVRVTQDKTEWSYDELNKVANGKIDAASLTSGTWTGSLTFDITYESSN